MTTIIAEQADAVLLDEEDPPYFSWGAVLAGAFAGAMVAFMLLAIGAGLGLTLAGPLNGATPLKTILTAGGIYFFAVEAFGFAVGGFVAGRLCGPVLESREEEMFRSGAHGLIVWAVMAAAGLALLLWVGALAAHTTGHAGMLGGARTGERGNEPTSPTTIAYWADTLLRVPPPGQAAAVQPAPAAVTATSPAPSQTQAPATAPASPATSPLPHAALPAEPAEGANENSAPASNSNSGTDTSGDTGDDTNGATEPPPTPSPAVYWHTLSSTPLLQEAAVVRGTEPTGAMETSSFAPGSRRVDFDERAELTRIIAANAAKPNDTPNDDRLYMAQLISAQTGISMADAEQRVDALLTHIHDQEAKTADTARKAAAYLSIWLGLSLFFGLLVATGAAILARMEEEDEDEMVVARVPPASAA